MDWKGEKMKLRCDKCGKKFETGFSLPKGMNLCDACCSKELKK
jgi:hypothetical protein